MKNVLYKVQREYYNTCEYEDHTKIDLNPKDVRLSHDFNFRKKKIDSTKDFFIKNYGNPLCSTNMEYVTFVVETYDDKLSIKLFTGYKVRNVGKKFYYTRKELRFITVNFKTNNIYSGLLIDYHKVRKRTSSLKCNFFIEFPLSKIFTLAKSSFMRGIEDSYQIAIDGIRIFTNVLNQKLNNNGFKISSKSTHYYDDVLFRYFLNGKGFKYSNNFYLYKGMFSDKNFRKIIKSGDGKLIESVMKALNLKGKIFKKVLHDIDTNFNYRYYKSIYPLFYRWINTDYDVLFKVLNEYKIVQVILEIDDNVNFDDLFTKEELKRMYNFFKKFVINDIVNVKTFSDHIYFFIQLKNYGEVDLKWTSEYDKSEFVKQHLDLSDKVEIYNEGLFYRNYPEFMDKTLNTIIESDDKYYPVLLKNTYDYRDESSVQSNCVKTYIKSPSSIIISLRKNSIDSKDRATIEYEISKDNNITKVVRVQTRGRFNNRLDSSWNKPISILDSIISKWSSKKDLCEITLTMDKTNNNHFNSKLVWVNNLLIWENKQVVNNQIEEYEIYF